MEIRKPLEAQLLAILRNHPEFAKMVQLEAGDFLDIRNAQIFRALRDIKTDVQPLTIYDEIKKRSPDFDGNYLEEVWFLDSGDDAVTFEDVQARCAAIRQERLRADVDRKLKAAIHTLEDAGTDVQVALDQISSVVLDASRHILGTKKPTAPEILDRSYNRTQGTSFPSGLVNIDNRLTSEGLREGQLWTISAQYKSGKSSVAMNICHSALLQGKSVCYICLEDSDESFNEMLIGVHSGVPLKDIEDKHEHVKRTYDPKRLAAINETERWLRHDVGTRFRVYDAESGVMSRKRIPTLFAADIALYGTNLFVCDYAQAWGSSYEDQEEIAQMLSRLALEHKVCIIVLSQVSNETIRNGGPTSMLSTKGSGSLGANSHVGMELRWVPDESTILLDPDLLKRIDATGIQHFLGLNAGPAIKGSNKPNGPSELTELGLHLKVARRGKPSRSILLIDRQSAKIVLQYQEPLRMQW